jgi:hypothetical protein
MREWPCKLHQSEMGGGGEDEQQHPSYPRYKGTWVHPANKPKAKRGNSVADTVSTWILIKRVIRPAKKRIL